ncbi:type II toxin-antitoxin system PemK/MazF family toxin [Modestobacter roseus]|uniref:type II toxin-antitoxin system PemK/MazF family toxin n=1 Tax=Modestobacter roseus TaxID=1181884 RepID=UPI0034DB4C82
MRSGSSTSIRSGEPAGRTGLAADSKAQAEQIRSVALKRIGPVLGRVPADLMQELDEALRLHLQL